MRGSIYFWLLLGMLFSFNISAQTQSPSASAKKVEAPALSFDPNKPETEIDLSDLEPKPATTKRRRLDRRRDVEEDDPIVASSNWARPAVGLFFAVTNNGVGRSMWKRTQDEALIGHSSELGFGVGTTLDFSYPGVLEESLRLQLGIMRVSVRADDATKNTYSSDRLENSATLFNLALMYRFSLGELMSFQGFWYGLGAQMNYVFATSRPASGGSQASQLNNSYGFSPVIAIGADVPIASFEDLTVSVQYLPPKGFTLLGGFRTSL